MKTLSVLIIAFISLTTNAALTNAFKIKVVSNSESIDLKNVEARLYYNCEYKTLGWGNDIGKPVEIQYKSCGKNFVGIELYLNSNNEIEIPEIQEFEHKKAKDLNNYKLSIGFKIKGQKVSFASIDVEGEKGILQLVENKDTLIIDTFKISDLKIKYRGVDLLTSNYKNGENASFHFEVKPTIEFNPKNKIILKGGQQSIIASNKPNGSLRDLQKMESVSTSDLVLLSMGVIDSKRTVDIDVNFYEDLYTYGSKNGTNSIKISKNIKDLESLKEIILK